MTRAEIDMKKSEGEYLKMGNTNLEDVVTREVSGVYRDFLMDLIGGKF